MRVDNGAKVLTLTLPRMNAGDSRRTLVAIHDVSRRRACPARGGVAYSLGECDRKSNPDRRMAPRPRHVDACTRRNDLRRNRPTPCFDWCGAQVPTDLVSHKPA